MKTTGNYTLRQLNIIILSMCTVGFLLSCYAYMVETKKEVDKSYEPMCDISEHISCTKVFTSKYGKGFGLLPKDSIFNLYNSLYGIISYPIFASLHITNNFRYSVVALILGIASNVLSLYLATILYMLSNVCIVCFGIYIVNAIIAYFSAKKVGKWFSKNVCEKKYKSE